jgi:hypothetical protein
MYYELGVGFHMIDPLMHALSMLGPMTQSPSNSIGLRRSADTDMCAAVCGLHANTRLYEMP